MINWHNNTFSKNMYYRYQTFNIPCLLAVPKKTKRTWQCACWKTYLVRFWVDEVVELSLCLSVSVSECPLVMFPFKCPFIWGPLLSNSAILPVLIYNTDLPYCVCDEILFNLNSCPSMRESSQSGLKTIQEMRSFFL